MKEASILSNFLNHHLELGACWVYLVVQLQLHSLDVHIDIGFRPGLSLF
jgi:hypothetical protein